MKYDVVIVGCGTTGATTAELLSRQGFEVIVIETNDRNWTRPSSGCFPNHNLTDSFPSIPDHVFERTHYTMRYVGKEKEAKVDGREFNTSLGKTLKWSSFKNHLLNVLEKDDLSVLFQHRAKAIHINREGVRIDIVDLVNKNESELRADMILLATGGQDFSLQTELGFERPNVVEGIQKDYLIPGSEFDTILGAEYNFHYDHRVSKIGPFWVTAYKDGFNCGYIDYPGKITPDRLERILEKFEPIQELLKGAKPTGSSTKVKRIACKPVKEIVKDRVALLGECAGLVHPFFYEGIWEGRLSGIYIAETLHKIRESDKKYTRENLIDYQNQIRQNLVKKFIKSGRGSQELFYDSPVGTDLFGIYIDLINQHKDIREKIVEAYNIEGSRFNLDNDRSIGERIYKKLPLSKKITLLPRFLRAM